LITLHSLKVTILAWGARYGMCIEDRRLLGHHSHPTLKSVLTYSREALSGPLAQVWCMFSEILDGSFDPESTQISRITRRRIAAAQVSADPKPISSFRTEVPVAEATNDGNSDQCVETALSNICESDVSIGASIIPEVPVKVPVSPEVLDSSSGSSSQSDSSDVSLGEMPGVWDDDDLLESAGFQPGDIELHESGFDTFQHNFSGVVHRRTVSEPLRLLCGRLVTESYSQISGLLRFDWPRCPQCASKLEKLKQ